MITRPYFLHALSPLHAGTGQGVGLIDLPIARERTTDHPLMPGSSVKGVLRDAARTMPDARVNEIFGSTEGSASMVRVSDARALAFPVKSDLGTFAWVTSPYVLMRFVRDSGVAAGFAGNEVPKVTKEDAVTAATSAVVDEGKVVLDGLPYRVTPDSGAKKVLDALAAAVFTGSDPTSSAWRRFFLERLVIVSDDAFTWFTQKATDVRAHVRIDRETGTVQPGALWYVETLPPETILAGVLQVAAVHPRQDPKAAFEVLEGLVKSPLQVGGDATTGAGRVQMVIGGGAA